MPPLPIINDTFRVAINWNLATAARTAANVIHVSSNSLTSPTDVAEAVRDAAVAAMWGPVNAGAQVQNLTVTPLDGTTASVELDVSTDSAWAGLTAGQFVPQVACLVKFTTALRGRSNRGRLFMPFISEAAQQDGVILDLAAVQTGWETFLANLTTADVDLVIASYLNENAHFVNSVLVENRIATQRRRNRRD